MRDLSVAAYPPRPRRDDLPAVEGDVAALYRESLPATRSGPLFNAFSYPTKISPEAIALFIATHTRPGDTVLDVFAGSGTTGIAARLCDQPTVGMLETAASRGLTPEWGPRNAVLYDVGVLGAFIARVMCTPPEPTRFAAAARSLLERAQESHGWLYDTHDEHGQPATVRHIIWSDVLRCPVCDEHTPYWDAAVRQAPLELASEFCCPGCRTTVAIDGCERVTEEVYDTLLDRKVVRRVRVPTRIHGRSGKAMWQRPASDADMSVASRAEAEPVPSCAPVAEIAWGDLYRSGYHTGISHLHHFYTPRNFLALAVLWQLVDECDDDLRDALRLLILSFNASHSTLMTRVVVKKNQKDFVLTGAQSGVLYISGLPVEKNVFAGVLRKIGTLEAAFALVYGSKSEVQVVNASSTALDMDDGSIDYLFTDPPFGDYIPYAEINQINELWLGSTTNRVDEIIVSPSAGKDVDDYGDLMSQVFSEAARVLSDDGLATVVFHSTRASVWRALTRAFDGAGLSVRTTSVLDKTQASFKQAVSAITAKGDPLLLLDKQSGVTELESVDDVIARVLRDANEHDDDAERTPERLFSRFVATCLRNDVSVTLDAADFYERIHSDPGVA